jgi:hypothetical protein
MVESGQELKVYNFVDPHIKQFLLPCSWFSQHQPTAVVMEADQPFLSNCPVASSDVIPHCDIEDRAVEKKRLRSLIVRSTSA